MTIDRTRRKTLGLAAGAAAASMFAIPGTARAQGIPTGGPIRILTGYPANGGRGCPRSPVTALRRSNSRPAPGRS